MKNINETHHEVGTQNEIRENKMVLNNCANSSRGIAALLLTCLALFFTPQAVVADNECTPIGVDPSVNPGPDSYICDQNSYPSISYTADGDLTVDVVGGGASTVEITDGDSATDGISLQAAGADSLTLTGGPEIEDDDSDVVLDLSTEVGAISIDVFRVDPGGSTDHGIRARSFGSGGGAADGGDISITGNVLSLGISGDRAIAGIQAITAGGDVVVSGQGGSGVFQDNAIYVDADGDINTDGGDITIDATGFMRGVVQAIYAETSGTGRVEIGGAGHASEVGTSQFGTPEGIAAIHAIGGTGGILIDIAQVTASGDGVVGVLTETPGLAEINVGDWNVAATDFGIRGLGGQVIVGQQAGVEDTEMILDLSGITDSSVVTISSLWNMTGVSVLSQTGDDLIQVEPDAIFRTSQIRDGESDALDEVTEIDFGGGNDTLNNAGTFQVGSREGGEAEFSIESHTLLTGLDNFNNSGLIEMGSTGSKEVGDGFNDDVLTLRGATFTGAGDSLIVMDINLNGVGQANCIDRLANGDLPGADCVDIRNGETAGQTVLLLQDRAPGDRGAFNPQGTVLIDVAGGSSSAEHFVIDPASENYTSELGGVLDKGLFFYPLIYDEANQQHKLYGLPGANALQFPLLAHAAQSAWRSSATSWFDRQRGLRKVLDDEMDLNKGIWFRLNTESGERDVMQATSGGGETFAFDNSYSQDTSGVTLGLDFLSDHGGGNDAWVVGGQIGYVYSSLEYDKSPNTVKSKGMSVGVYGSYLAGGFFVDALINGNWLQMDNNVPGLNLFPRGTMLSTDIRSLGAQVESGWRWNMGRLGIEPLASLSYVRTDFDDISIPADDPLRFGADIKYDDPVSFRGGLGVRLSADDVLPGFVPTAVSLTTRVVNEFDGESKVDIVNFGPTASLANEFEGTFTEVSGSVTVSNAAKTVAGYLNVDGVFESDYESVGAEVGFRYQW